MQNGFGDFGVIILFGVLAVAGGIAAWIYEKKKREALIAFASERGWRLRIEKSRMRPSFPSDIFDRGRSRWSRYRLFKTFDGAVPGAPEGGDAPVEAFEYHYAVTSGSGKNRRTTHYYFTCMVIGSPVPLGRVLIRDEHLGDKFVQGLGFDDIDLEDPEFSAQFVVKADDRKDAYDLLGPTLMSYMRQWKGITAQTHHSEVLLTMKGRLDIKDVVTLERFGRGFLESLPRLLVNNARVRAGLSPMTEAGDVRSSVDT